MAQRMPSQVVEVARSNYSQRIPSQVVEVARSNYSQRMPSQVVEVARSNYGATYAVTSSRGGTEQLF